MELLIKNGLVIDPANQVYSKLNLLVRDGRVAGLSRKEPPCERVIDAEGMCVCPGFIDIHMHEDPYDEARGEFAVSISDCMLRMGVTTVIGGNCGINVLDPARYLELVDQKGLPVHVGLMAGHTFMREKAGCRDKYAGITEAQLETVKGYLQESLDAGCFGISYGIRYVPGIDRRELHETAALCKRDDRIISAHVRDDAEYIFESVLELLEAGEAHGLPVEVSHIGSMGGYGQMRELLAMIDARRANGLRVSCDCYPYYAFSTRIGETTYDEGFLERYQSDYSCIELCEGPYKGQRCTKEIFDELRTHAPRTITVGHVMKPEDVDMALLHPGVMVASDGLMDAGQGHPRAAGTFPRFFNQYVTTGRISLHEGIAKMTSMQAEKLGLRQKGRLNAGADADIVIFDPSAMKDQATFQEPAAGPSGIRYVLIGGETAVENGVIVNHKLGRALRK